MLMWGLHKTILHAWQLSGLVGSKAYLNTSEITQCWVTGQNRQFNEHKAGRSGCKTVRTILCYCTRCIFVLHVFIAEMKALNTARIYAALPTFKGWSWHINAEYWLTLLWLDRLMSVYSIFKKFWNDTLLFLKVIRFLQGPKSLVLKNINMHINHRITMGNSCDQGLQNLLRSKLLRRGTKVRVTFMEPL
jgi:hypothetical protein